MSATTTAHIKELRATIAELERELFDLTAKVIYLIVEYPGWSKDGDEAFTFPDGDTWHRFNPGQDSKDKGNAPG